VFIWAENPDTHTHIQQEINDLQSRLQALGLSTDTLSCCQGKPPADYRHQPTTGMIDYKA